MAYSRYSSWYTSLNYLILFIRSGFFAFLSIGLATLSWADNFCQEWIGFHY